MISILKKFKNYLLVSILCAVSFIGGVTINSINAKDNNILNNKYNVTYDYVWVNGTKYIVFMSPSGDIEVVR